MIPPFDTKHRITKAESEAFLSHTVRIDLYKLMTRFQNPVIKELDTSIALRVIDYINRYEYWYIDTLHNSLKFCFPQFSIFVDARLGKTNPTEYMIMMQIIGKIRELLADTSRCPSERVILVH